MPKLWRAPIPIVRITAPQITATQKLRWCGLAVASDGSMELPALADLMATARRRKYRIGMRRAEAPPAEAVGCDRRHVETQIGRTFGFPSASRLAPPELEAPV